MQHFGFRSLLVLTKIGYDLRDQFADTFHEPVEEAFGSLLDALDDAEGVLSLAPSQYEWASDDSSFRYAS
ncbi:hypothetical protein OCOJLMKI_2234 [Methylobacterium iners]|uniref:Uncharacterized protein n=1 Tax=Methylobacterium iners TaxID=418707 RepID=A0ABQ4RZT8_9HYPH|nr:hypothetical protein OCOJLMKI_2234 [Methylobacterium iners]